MEWKNSVVFARTDEAVVPYVNKTDGKTGKQVKTHDESSNFQEAKRFQELPPSAMTLLCCTGISINAT